MRTSIGRRRPFARRGRSLSPGKWAAWMEPSIAGTNLVVSGSVSEKGSFLGGKDDMDFFTNTFTAPTYHSNPQTRQIYPGLSFSINYAGVAGVIPSAWVMT